MSRRPSNDRHVLGRWVAVAAVVAAAGVAVPAAAESPRTTGAAPATATVDSPIDTSSPPAGGSGLDPREYRRYRAGYTATAPGGDLDRARARFVIPAYECVDDDDAVGVGLGSEPSFGLPRYLAYVALMCDRDEAAEYELRVNVRGYSDSARAFAGDEVRVSTRHGDSGKWVWAKVRNLTTGKVVRSGGRPYPHATAQDVDFGAFPLFSGRVLDSPDFGRLPIKHVRMAGADSAPVCIESTGPERRTRADRETGELEIGTSRVHGCHFALRWHSY